MAHNESLNIWTHLLGAFLMLVLIIKLWSSADSTFFYTHSVPVKDVIDLHRISKWPISIFLLSAILCLSGSAAFHLFYCMTLKVNIILLRIDYAGICILIFGSCFPPLVYGLYCQPQIYQNYLMAIGISSLTVFSVSMMDFIHTQKWRIIKSLMYSGLGTFAGLSIIHVRIKSEPDYSFAIALPYYIGMVLSYLVGLIIYAFRCPERFKPGTFDICVKFNYLKAKKKYNINRVIHINYGIYVRFQG